MGKISRIQLRGISRTPSDRLTEDGGCEESLNVYLDNAESAPAFKPEDVTKKLGLPDDLLADKIFLHKTTSYENYIVQQGQKLIAYTSVGQKEVVALSADENLTDIDAIGNIVIITTGETLYYALWKNEAYKFIGNSLPVPSIRFDVIGNDDENFETSDSAKIYLDSQVTGSTAIAQFDKSAWEKAVRGVADNDEVNELMAQINKDLWDKVQQKKEKIGKWGYFSCPRLVRYAIRLYDGSYIHHSVPVLIGAGAKEWLTVEGGTQATSTQSSWLNFTIELYYKAIAKLIAWDVEDWTDIIAGVDIFISEDITFPRINEDFATCTQGGGKIYFKGYDNAHETAKTEVLDKANFYKIVSVAVGDLDSLKAGIDLHKDNDVEKSETLVVKERLTSDYMMSHEVIPGSAMIYNSRLLINASKVKLPAPYTQLNGVFCNVKKAYSDTEVNHQRQRTYKYKFFIRRNNGEEYSVIARSSDGSMNFVTPLISNNAPSNLESTWYADPMAWIAYPDSNCYKVQVDLGNGDIADIDMSAHPSLSCAYAFLGLDEYYFNQKVAHDSSIAEEEKKTYSVNNQVMLSEFSNPFVFPAGNRYSLQSKVIGIALATTSLSQGQFGQFPLYVFTEDGIWAMETASDGSFLTSKPLSREVCVNPSSITSIDNAVVFVTDKGVMLLSGSQVVNISPFMNGRHYTLDVEAKTILQNHQDYAHLIPAITDTTPFMAFMKKTSIAYDYPGQRLICIAPDEKYQYIYKLDTETWHKVSHDEKLVAPINSYPECLVQGKFEKDAILLYIEEVEETTEEIFAYFYREASKVIPFTKEEFRKMFFEGKSYELDMKGRAIEPIDDLITYLEGWRISLTYDGIKENKTLVYDISTILDAEDPQPVERGLIVTRPLTLGEPDVKKVIQDIRIRGTFDKKHVQYILLGSDDGIRYYSTRLKQKSWKLFRIVIASNLSPHERISWIDVMFDTKYTTRLR